MSANSTPVLWSYCPLSRGHHRLRRVHDPHHVVALIGSGPRGDFQGHSRLVSCGQVSALPGLGSMTDATVWHPRMLRCDRPRRSTGRLLLPSSRLTAWRHGTAAWPMWQDPAPGLSKSCLHPRPRSRLCTCLCGGESHLPRWGTHSPWDLRDRTLSSVVRVQSVIVCLYSDEGALVWLQPRPQTVQTDLPQGLRAEAACGSPAVASVALTRPTQSA